MGLIAKIAAAVCPPRSEIDKVEAACWRYRDELDEMNRRWRNAGALCCPGCMFGQRYTDVADQLGRTRAWLIVLLRRRGRPDDLELVKSCEIGAWP